MEEYRDDASWYINCPVCGKEMYIRYKNMKEYAYQHNRIYMCSWTCLQKTRDLSTKELNILKKKQNFDGRTFNSGRR